MPSRIRSFLPALVLFTLAGGEETCENFDSREQTSETTCTGEESKHFHDDFNRDNWVDNNENKTLADLWFNLECDYLYKKPRSIPTKAEFRASIDLYNSLADLTDRLDPDLETFQIKTEVKQSEGKGRGVFALESVKKGSVLRTTDSAYFESGDEYREFILELEKDFACDVLQWAYSYRINDVPYVIVDLDNATMCNDGGLDYANMGCLEGKEFDCDLYEYAIRDIKEGDEILSNYAIMDDEPAWSDLGLL